MRIFDENQLACPDDDQFEEAKNKRDAIFWISEARLWISFRET